MFSIFNKECYLKKPKKVSFHTLVNVVLVPCRLDYFPFYDELWWRTSDYTFFYYSAKKEINDYLIENPFISQSEIKKILYQPNYSILGKDYCSGMYLFA